MEEEILSSPGWIYVCADIARFGWSKVGQSAAKLVGRRVGSQTANAGYLLIVAFKVPPGEAFAIEQRIHRKLPRREVHRTTGEDSEWFNLAPWEAVNLMKAELVNCLGSYYDEDGNNTLSQIAHIAPLTPHRLMSLAARSSHPRETDYYVACVNGVRRELRLPELRLDYM